MIEPNTRKHREEGSRAANKGNDNIGGKGDTGSSDTIRNAYAYIVKVAGSRQRQD